MLIETLLALSLKVNPVNIPAMVVTQPAHAQVVFAGYTARSSSFSSGRSSFSSSSFRSSSFSSRPSSSSFSRPSTPAPTIRSTPTPSVSVPKAPSIPSTTPKPSTSSVVRINKQTVTPKVSTSTSSTVRPTPAAPVVSGSSTYNRSSTPTRVVTREHYVERYNDGGIAGNPWFWMYMFDNNRSQPAQTQSQPTQVLVKSSEGKDVAVPEQQLVVKKYSYNPIREFLVFALGGGIGVLVGRKVTLG